MDNTYILGPNGELYHWGIKGQRWGVRRYQNKDGSLTAAGKKRYAKLEAEMEKLGGKKSGTSDKVGDSGAPKTKSVGEMTDQEINDKINRMNLEKRYNDTVASTTPKKDETSEPPKKSETEKSETIDVSKPKKKIADMTDEEIKTAMARLELEKTLHKSMKEISDARTSAARKIVNEMLVNSAKNIGQQTVTFFMGEGVNLIAKKLLNYNDNIVNSKKGQKDK